MLLHEDSTREDSQKKPGLHFGESFPLNVRRLYVFDCENVRTTTCCAKAGFIDFICSYRLFSASTEICLNLTVLKKVRKKIPGSVRHQNLAGSNLG